MGRIGKKLKGKNLNMFGNPIHQPTKEYKEGWNRIFGKKEQDELKESYEQSKRNKKERTESEKLQEELKPIDKETEKFFDDIANNTPNEDQFKNKNPEDEFNGA